MNPRPYTGPRSKRQRRAGRPETGPLRGTSKVEDFWDRKDERQQPICGGSLAELERRLRLV